MNRLSTHSIAIVGGILTGFVWCLFMVAFQELRQVTSIPTQVIVAPAIDPQPAEQLNIDPRIETRLQTLEKDTSSLTLELHKLRKNVKHLKKGK